MNLSKIIQNKISPLVARGIIVAVLLVGGVLVWQNRLVVKEEFFPRRVIISTDKVEYEQGEIVKATVFNELKFSIYADFWKGSWRVLQYKNEKWNEVFIGKQRTVPICLCGEYPDGNCPLWEAPQEKFDEIKSSETVTWSWDQKILKGTDKNCLIWIDASPGKYKVEFRHFYTLDLDEREWKTVYSNEFRIKEIVQPQEISCQSELAKNQAQYLGLSCEEFNILEASVREYLYKKYPFTRETDFGIRYERVEATIEGVPQGGVVVDAFANFRTPPVVIRAAFYDGNAWVISEESSLEK